MHVNDVVLACPCFPRHSKAKGSLIVLLLLQILQFLVLLEQRVGKKDAQCESALKLLHMLIKVCSLSTRISLSHPILELFSSSYAPPHLFLPPSTPLPSLFLTRRIS
jgi:hypothetical protein